MRSKVVLCVTTGGLAQISGRDELEIADKAKLDGEYVKILKKGGIRAFLFDCRMIVGTVTAVLKHDGVVEGGTGAVVRPVELVKPEDTVLFLCNKY